jgi:hypothetical protein
MGLSHYKKVERGVQTTFRVLTNPAQHISPGRDLICYMNMDLSKDRLCYDMERPQLAPNLVSGIPSGPLAKLVSNAPMRGRASRRKTATRQITALLSRRRTAQELATVTSWRQICVL